MITTLRKGKLYKQVVSSRGEYAGVQTAHRFKTLVLHSDKNGRFDFDAEHNVWSSREGDMENVHSQIVKELKDDGWEEISHER